MNYSSWLSSAATMMAEQDTTNADFLTIVPDAIAYAEGRMYRELDLLATHFSDSTTSFTAGTRTLTLPSGTLVVEQVNVITPASTQPAAGLRNPLTPTTREFLDVAWPSATGTTLPTHFAMQDQTTIVVGPWPDATYVVEIVGQQTQTALSATNTTTALTAYLPDAFLACTMIFMSAYQKNFGGQSDNPQTAQSWENQYGVLMSSANVIEFRKKQQSQAWSAKQPNQVATPQRM